MKIGDYETNPIADRLPLMEGEEYEKLVADIRTNGLLMPIWLFRGAILDGRNRLRACLESGVEPRFEDKSDSDPFRLAYSANIPRRNMTASVRSMVVAGWASLGRGQHVKSAPGADHPVLSAKQAAEMAGVSERTIEQAKAVLAHGDDETKTAVARGDISVKEAAERMRPKQHVERQPPNKPRAADLASMINAALKDRGCQTRYTNTTSENVEMRVAYDGRVYVLRLEIEQ